jgi:hypothetical protein
LKLATDVANCSQLLLLSKLTAHLRFTLHFGKTTVVKVEGAQKTGGSDGGGAAQEENADDDGGSAANDNDNNDDDEDDDDRYVVAVLRAHVAGLHSTHAGQAAINTDPLNAPRSLVHPLNSQ